MQLEFEEHKPERSAYRAVSERIYRQLQLWSYVPSARCIQDTFNIGFITATKVRKRLIQEKGMTTAERIRRHFQKGRCFLSKWLRNVYGEIVFRGNISNLPYPEHMTNRKPLFKKKQKQLKLTEIPVMTIELPEIPEEYDITKEVQI